MSLWLNDDELETLTGYRQRTKQRAELARMGFKFRTRHDGFLLVDRAQFGQVEPAKGRVRKLDWDAVGA